MHFAEKVHVLGLHRETVMRHARTLHAMQLQVGKWKARVSETDLAEKMENMYAEMKRIPDPDFTPLKESVGLTQFEVDRVVSAAKLPFPPMPGKGKDCEPTHHTTEASNT